MKNKESQKNLKKNQNITALKYFFQLLEENISKTKEKESIEIILNKKQNKEA